MATLQELMETNMLVECAYECTKQSRWKETTQRYIADMLVRNLELQNEVLDGRYSVRPTTDFFLNERGHIRKIEAPVVRDRIVQKSLTVKVLTPSLRPYVIYDNYASLKMRGTHFARKRFEILLRRYMSRNGMDGYVLLIDIKKYFESIDHEVLKKLIAPKIASEPAEVVDLIHYIIDHSSHSDKGLNLGSEAPQILAVYYLNPIDQFVKVVKGIKYYGRYMDDIFVIAKTKAELKSLLAEIEAKLSELRLNVNKKKTHIVKLTHGFTFLQVKYNILPTGKILKRPAHSKVVRERRRLRAFKRRLDDGFMTEDQVWNCYKSWRGSVVREHNACTKTLRSTDALYASLFPAHVDVPRKGRTELYMEAFRDAETRDLKKLVV